MLWVISAFDYRCHADVYYEHAYAEDFLSKSEAAVRSVLQQGCATLGLGGDHFITYPILRAHAERLGRPVALIHFDVFMHDCDIGHGPSP